MTTAHATGTARPPDFDNSYSRLPAHFYARQQPVPVAAPQRLAINEALAGEIGIDPAWLAGDDGLAMLAGNRLPETSRPLAMAYAGHQFGNWVPQLGDGRALLIGELVDASGVRRDIQLKGSGPTPFSRGGDGRSSIGPVVREFLASEAMAALGIPTTRALGAVSTGETVMRQRPEPGGILCRVAASHVRIGTFEYFARRGDNDATRTLADYLIDRQDPDLSGQPDRHGVLLERTIRRTAELVSAWMQVGFIHGVMNTDNTSMAGETIDYGPFGFIDHFDPQTVYSSIDRRGRYAWDQQPGIAQWNLARLAECWLPLLAEDPDAALARANAAIEIFPGHFEAHFHAGLVAKIGLTDATPEARELAFDLLRRMHANQADMTLTFRRLGDLATDHSGHDAGVRELFTDPGAFDQWAVGWRELLSAEGRDPAARQRAMQRINPAYILRNHLAQHAVDSAIEGLDFAPMHELSRVLARPFDDQPEAGDQLGMPPRPDQRVLQTFCGT